VSVKKVNGTAKSGIKKDESESGVGGEGKTRTRMVVRLHPGQEHRISAYLEDQDACAGRTWVHGSHTCDSLSSILGLEISFSAMPQDIDIQIIPGTQEPTNEGGAEVLKAME